MDPEIYQTATIGREFNAEIIYMKLYRLVIYNQEKLFGHFESDLPWSLTAINKVAENLKPDDGYRLELFLAEDEKRFIESSPDGIKVISREPLFKPVPLSKIFNHR